MSEAGDQTTSGGATQAAIEQHYDVGRDFYSLWLDARRVYSCAFWADELDDDLEAAQTAKLAWHASAARAYGASRVLDVGCGWGAMLAFLAGEAQAGQVTGLTLSSDQADACRAACPEADVRLEDWRDHVPEAPYDAIVSIGAFEHFTRQGLTTEERRDIYRDFFRRGARWLRDGGRLSLQSIAYEDVSEESGPVATFFTEIFPESALPHLSDIVTASEPWFRVLSLRSDADQYERTLHLWQRRLEARRDEAIALVGRPTYRRYLQYLRVSRAMFDRRVCTLYRIAFERRPG
jgi:cyclopropane-fatty-acyl-phospholipid synthase